MTFNSFDISLLHIFESVADNPSAISFAGAEMVDRPIGGAALRPIRPEQGRRDRRP
jgi:hypothetical protein